MFRKWASCQNPRAEDDHKKCFTYTKNYEIYRFIWCHFTPQAGFQTTVCTTISSLCDQQLEIPFSTGYSKQWRKRSDFQNGVALESILAEMLHDGGNYDTANQNGFVTFN